MLSSYFYPTTVAFLVDQDRTFLNELSLELESELAYRLFENIQFAWELIESKHSANQSYHQQMLSNTEQELEHVSRVLFSWERFNEISVIVLDLSRLTFNHLTLIDDLYAKLAWPRPKLIVLTHDISPKNFILELFTTKKIQCLFLKQDKQLVKKLTQAIKELQQQYFAEISAAFIQRVVNTTMPYLKDPALIQRFRQICRLTQVTEYYLCERNRGFLLVNANGRLSFFAVRTEAEVVANKIAWKNKWYEAKKIYGEKTYWYSIIKDEESLIEILDKKIWGYRDYLRQIWPPI